ncbi:MAG TPA: sugar phosphorylase [Desulfobacteria bacterium]|nr:sugar phosphorylase [Desulfobacteria bacterium]
MNQRMFQKLMRGILRELYPDEDLNEILKRITGIVETYQSEKLIIEKRRQYGDRIVLSEDDAILITYPDSLRETGEKPLQTLHRFLKSHVKSAVSTVHLLPFFKSSSDGGFSVIEYGRVDPEFGAWNDILAIGKEYRLMADLVLNHVSSRSEWFQSFLRGHERYRDYFLSFDEAVDVSKVFRPREHPLLTQFDTAMGGRFVWTTFSEDQIDLNFHNPQVLLEILDVFMQYLSRGIEFIRLDAIAYVWKDLGTDCVNLPQTHEIVKLLRTVAEFAAPYAVIVTEVNFPYKDNVSYIEARHEANLAYHFALPPLVIDGFAQGDASILQEETARIRQDLPFMNFLSSHDGIGLLSARDILPHSRFQALLEMIEAHGGGISYKATEHEPTPYEMNTTVYDAINDPNRPDNGKDVKRYMAACAIALSDKGIPGIYIHCLLGSRNNLKGVKESGIKRMINREKLSFKTLCDDLSNPESRTYQVLTKFIALLNVRKEIRAFHHSVERVVLYSDERLFIMNRRQQKGDMLAVINLSEDIVALPQYKGKFDRIENSLFDGSVEPYGVYFLE